MTSVALPVGNLKFLRFPSDKNHEKRFSGITYSADCFAYCVMAHLLWPTRSEQYFLLKGPSSADLEELDEFNEAPHIVNNSYTSLSSMSSLDICRYDDPPKNKPASA